MSDTNYLSTPKNCAALSGCKGFVLNTRLSAFAKLFCEHTRITLSAFSNLTRPSPSASVYSSVVSPAACLPFKDTVLWLSNSLLLQTLDWFLQPVNSTILYCIVKLIFHASSLAAIRPAERYFSKCFALLLLELVKDSECTIANALLLLLLRLTLFELLLFVSAPLCGSLKYWHKSRQTYAAARNTRFKGQRQRSLLS